MMTTFPDFPSAPNDSVLSINNPLQFDLPVKKEALEWLLKIIETEEKVLFQFVELVYVDEEKIIDINHEYLGRDYVTDIISFNYADENEFNSTDKKEIEGTLYCCAPRIAEQSRELDSDSVQEFYRIFIHGLLHLAGYNDSSPEEKETMTQLEDDYLEQLSR